MSFSQRLKPLRSSSLRLNRTPSSATMSDSMNDILSRWNYRIKKIGPFNRTSKKERQRSLSNSPDLPMDERDTRNYRVMLLLDDNKISQKYVEYLKDPVRERIMYGYTKDELEEYIDIASQQDKDVNDKHSEELAQRFRELQSKRADREWQEMKKRAEKRFSSNTGKSTTIYSDPTNYAYGGINKRKTYKTRKPCKNE